MADRALFGTAPARPTAEQQRLEDREQRRNLRIAIRQLERAELYLVALYSLDLAVPEAEASVDDIVQRIRSLQRSLVQRRVSG